MSGSSDQLAVMRPAYMSLPSPNITCPEETDQGSQPEVGNFKMRSRHSLTFFLFRLTRAG